MSIMQYSAIFIEKLLVIIIYKLTFETVILCFSKITDDVNVCTLK